MNGFIVSKTKAFVVDSEFITKAFSGSFCIVYTIVDLFTWIVVFNYYSIIKQMSKLREEAVIQCPAPIVSPYPYFRENIYESENGLRHTLCDNDQYNYVA